MTADEATPSDGAGQGSGDKDQTAGFHRLVQKRTSERDLALAERDALKAQLDELNAYADAEADEADDPPTPRSNGAAREMSGKRDDGSAEYARRELRSLVGDDNGPGGWPL